MRKDRGSGIRVGTGMALALLVGAGVLALPGPAGAQPTVAPVKLTFTATPKSDPSCRRCLHLTGRVHSPKPVCRRKRWLAGAFRYRPGTEVAGTTYRQRQYVQTDGQGRFDRLSYSVEPLAWIELSVPKQRIGRVLCKAARAKVTL